MLNFGLLNEILVLGELAFQGCKIKGCEKEWGKKGSHHFLRLGGRFKVSWRTALTDIICSELDEVCQGWKLPCVFATRGHSRGSHHQDHNSLAEMA